MSTLASMNILCPENFILDGHAEDIFAENEVLTNETAKTVQVLPQIDSGSSKVYSFMTVASTISVLLSTFHTSTNTKNTNLHFGDKVS